jgi:hypothetical protein
MHSLIMVLRVIYLFFSQIQYLMDHSIRLSVIVALLLTTLKPNLSRISLPEKEMILQCTQFIASTTPNLQVSKVMMFICFSC